MPFILKTVKITFMKGSSDNNMRAYNKQDNLLCVVLKKQKQKRVIAQTWIKRVLMITILAHRKTITFRQN